MDIKRKRMAKTTRLQYEEYLSLMETDTIFRTGTINPNIDPKYLTKKWEELASTLNAVGGPSLSVLEWKKRFNDWKNGTRAKYRKIVEDRKGTGGGPACQPILSTLEERGLAVWGKVAVTSSGDKLVTGRLQATLPIHELPQVATVMGTEPDEPAIKEEVIEFLADEDIHVGNEPQVLTRVVLPITPRVPKTSKERSLQNIEDELFTYEKNVDEVEESKLDIEKRKLEVENRRLDLEETRLKFEIQKYMFENPGFKFSL